MPFYIAAEWAALECVYMQICKYGVMPTLPVSFSLSTARQHQNFRLVLYLVHSEHRDRYILHRFILHNGSLEKFRLIYYKITVQRTSDCSVLMVAIFFGAHIRLRTSIGQMCVTFELVFHLFRKTTWRNDLFFCLQNSLPVFVLGNRFGVEYVSVWNE